jgi:hypothetical protein
VKTIAFALAALVVCAAVWAGGTTAAGTVAGAAVQSAPTELASVVGGAAPAQEEPMPWHFAKVYRPYIWRELVWFNGREGDLERHAVRRHGLIYITLTDLIRHLSGSIVWGPSARFVEVKRGDVTVRVIPGGRKAIVNGQAKALPGASFRSNRLLWVPVQPFAGLFGAKSTWNAAAHHLDVTFQ